MNDLAYTMTILPANLLSYFSLQCGMEYAYSNVMMIEARFEQRDMETRTFQIRFPHDVLAEVERIAVEETRSINQQLLHIVKEWLNNRAK